MKDYKSNKDQPFGIIICGLNGSGKTTLGRELAQILNVKHIDVEDYHFLASEIPYSNPRSSEEAVALMFADIQKYHSFVLSTVNGCYLGEEISAMYVLAVYLSAPDEARLKRVVQRGYDKFGDRVRVGGDMYAQEVKFHQFVASRTPDEVELWLQSLACPVIHVDGMADYRENAVKIAHLYDEILGKI